MRNGPPRLLRPATEGHPAARPGLPQAVGVTAAERAARPAARSPVAALRRRVQPHPRGRRHRDPARREGRRRTGTDAVPASRRASPRRCRA
ncbi:MAG: hypothetical protein E6R06_19740 [Mycobacterium sp.]|nr:MAG: hypothetical protein E6R06_19740 [Mycobacterium sp.]